MHFLFSEFWIVPTSHPFSSLLFDQLKPLWYRDISLPLLGGGNRMSFFFESDSAETNLFSCNKIRLGLKA